MDVIFEAKFDGPMVNLILDGKDKGTFRADDPDKMYEIFKPIGEKAYRKLSIVPKERELKDGQGRICVWKKDNEPYGPCAYATMADKGKPAVGIGFNMSNRPSGMDKKSFSGLFKRWTIDMVYRCWQAYVCEHVKARDRNWVSSSERA